MNLHGIAGPAVAVVNPTIYGTVKISTGNVTNADFSRTPTYATTTNVPLQVQALSGREIQHVDALNIQGVVRAVYAFGDVEGLDRVDGKGGDLMIFPETPGGTAQTWLIVAVLEHWPDWTKVAVTLQNGS